MDSDQDQEISLFHPYPCVYYVQSPSTISHANSADVKTNNNLDESTLLSPTRSDNTNVLLNKVNPEASRFTLSRYSSSLGSSNSFLNDHAQNKKIIGRGGSQNVVNRLVIVDGRGDVVGYGAEEGDDDDEDDDDDDDFYGRRGGWWYRYCSFRRNPSCAWICLQICWRFVLSLGIALLVFYLSTKPPSPKMSIKVSGIREFELSEGVDASGVTTKILTCNCSMDLLIDNKSKLFGLHIHPPVLEMSFGRLSFAMSRGPKLYAESHSSTLFRLTVGTRNKPMYGAGRSMQDFLESGNGLPISIRVSLTSNFRIVWNLIRPKFQHQAECLLVLDSAYDKKHLTQAFNSTCRIF